VKVEELLDRGVDVHFAHEGLDLRTPAGRFAAEMQAVSAAHYSRNLSDEATKGFYGRLKQGVYPGPAPLGYANQGAGRPKAFDEAVAPLVRMAFELYATGKFSVRTLADEMRQRGLRKRTGRPLRLGEMAQLLRNPFYIGIMRIKRTGETFDGKHPALISTGLFRRVQALLDGRKVRPVRQHTFVFQQRLRCGCGRLLVGERQKGHIYYRCHRFGCHECVREEVVDDAWRQLMDRLVFAADEENTIRDAVKAELGASSQRVADVYKALNLRRVQVEVRLQRATDALIEGLLERQDFAARKKTLLMERRAVDEELSRLEEDEDSETSFWGMFELANNAAQLYETANLEERQELLDAVCSNLEVRSKRPMFTLVPFFQAVVDRTKPPNGAPFQERVRTPPNSAPQLAQTLMSLMRAMPKPALIMTTALLKLRAAAA
jgi:hypothetical protein